MWHERAYSMPFILAPVHQKSTAPRESIAGTVSALPGRAKGQVEREGTAAG